MTLFATSQISKNLKLKMDYQKELERVSAELQQKLTHETRLRVSVIHACACVCFFVHACAMLLCTSMFVRMYVVECALCEWLVRTCARTCEYACASVCAILSASSVFWVGIL